MTTTADWYDARSTAEGDDARRYQSLSAAFDHQQTPLENRAFIRSLVESVGISSLHERGPYISAVRSQAGPALNIHHGYTNGFRSEEEILEAVGNVSRWASSRVVGTWGVSHPIAGRASGGGGMKTVIRDFGYCPDCFLALPATRVCNRCAA